jgi:fermentation-respiration switch protein FrsA (DUF1100 family)
MEWLKALLVAVLLGYTLFALFVWFAQERLLFYPPPLHGKASAPAGWSLEEVRLAMADGTALAGVLVKPPGAPAPLVVYFGGNAEEVTAYAARSQALYGERAALYVNYRGYGASAGRPSESALVSDGVEIVDWARRRTDVDGARFAIHGVSLGTGVAVQVATQRAPRCLVLTSPFDSARAVAQRIYPWLPVGFLIRHPFDSLARAPALKVPVLVLMGDVDTLIPMNHSLRLAGAWGGPVEQAVFAGFGHNDIGVSPSYDATIRAFLGRHL